MIRWYSSVQGDSPRAFLTNVSLVATRHTHTRLRAHSVDWDYSLLLDAHHRFSCDGRIMPNLPAFRQRPEETINSRNKHPRLKICRAAFGWYLACTPTAYTSSIKCSARPMNTACTWLYCPNLNGMYNHWDLFLWMLREGLSYLELCPLRVASTDNQRY